MGGACMFIKRRLVSLIESNNWGIFETERNSAFMEWAVSQFSYQQSWGFTSQSTQNMSFRRRSSWAISWRSSEETKPNTICELHGLSIESPRHVYCAVWVQLCGQVLERPGCQDRYATRTCWLSIYFYHSHLEQNIWACYCLRVHLSSNSQATHPAELHGSICFPSNWIHDCSYCCHSPVCYTTALVQLVSNGHHAGLQ